MATSFEKKEWVDRQSENPNRRKLVSTGVTDVYDIERLEGEVTEVGNAYNADNMNDLEDRIDSGFANLYDTGVKISDANNVFTSSTLDACLYELFQYAASGKKAIASAIGSNASSSNSFAVLAGLITSGKSVIASTIGSGSSANTFQSLADLINALKATYQNTINSLNAYISSGKYSIANAIGATRGGTPSGNDEFSTLASYITNYKKSFYVGSDYVNYRSIGASSSYYQDFDMNFGFIPSYIFIYDVSTSAHFDTGHTVSSAYIINIHEPIPGGGYDCGITNVTSNGFRLNFRTGYSVDKYTINSGNVTIVALG